jgi:hypothetical protein
MKSFYFLSLCFLFLISCSKATEDNFKKINIGLAKKEVVKIVGEGNKGKDSYNDGNMMHSLTYINDTLISITYDPIDKQNKDSAICLGLLDDFIFSMADQNGSARLLSVSIGSLNIIYNDTTKFQKPLIDDIDLFKHGACGHIFRIKGLINSENLTMTAKPIEDVTCLRLGDKAVFNAPKNNGLQLKIIDNQPYWVYSLKDLKGDKFKFRFN